MKQNYMVGRVDVTCCDGKYEVEAPEAFDETDRQSLPAWALPLLERVQHHRTSTAAIIRGLLWVHIDRGKRLEKLRGLLEAAETRNPRFVVRRMTGEAYGTPCPELGDESFGSRPEAWEACRRVYGTTQGFEIDTDREVERHDKV